jgi:hypothetical protein
MRRPLDAEHLDRLVDVGAAEERAEVEEEAGIADAVDRLVERGESLLAVEDEVGRTLGERGCSLYRPGLNPERAVGV